MVSYQNLTSTVISFAWIYGCKGSVLSSITSDPSNCTISSHPLPILSCIHVCTHPPLHPPVFSMNPLLFSKVIFILLITCKTLCTPMSVLPQTRLVAKILLPSKACCNRSIPQRSLLNLVISSIQFNIVFILNTRDTQVHLLL